MSDLYQQHSAVVEKMECLVLVEAVQSIEKTILKS